MLPCISRFSPDCFDHLAIPSVPNGGNHTRDFAAAAATPAAFQACLDVSKALAATGVRVLIDDEYFAEASLIEESLFESALTLGHSGSENV